MPIISVEVDDETLADGISVRLDRYIACGVAGINRSQLKNGATDVTLNGKCAKLSAKVRLGDKITVSWEESIPAQFSPENIPLDILYEDENAAVINKKQGMVTHPAAGHWTGTLVNALLYHYSRDAIAASGDEARCGVNMQRHGIVHRLDKDTSGAIITAKNRAAEEWFQKQFFERRVKKEYIAIVAGRPPAAQGNIKTRLVRDPRNRKRFKAIPDEGKSEKLPGKKLPSKKPFNERLPGKFAHTAYRCIACYGQFSLLRLRLKTGRTHQIRAHLKYLGCPVLGDPIYGEKNKIFPDATLLLHARLLSVRLSEDAPFSDFVAPVPARFKRTLKTLHELYEKCRILSP